MSSEIIAKFGFRTYCFYHPSDLSKAREIWATPCSQEEFEDILENLGIDFDYELGYGE